MIGLSVFQITGSMHRHSDIRGDLCNDCLKIQDQHKLSIQIHNTGNHTLRRIADHTVRLDDLSPVHTMDSHHTMHMKAGTYHIKIGDQKHILRWLIHLFLHTKCSCQIHHCDRLSTGTECSLHVRMTVRDRCQLLTSNDLPDLCHIDSIIISAHHKFQDLKLICSAL